MGPANVYCHSRNMCILKYINIRNTRLRECKVVLKSEVKNSPILVHFENSRPDVRHLKIGNKKKKFNFYKEINL